MTKEIKPLIPRKHYGIKSVPPGSTLTQVEAEISRDVKNLLKSMGIFFRRIEGTAKLVHNKGGRMVFAKSESSGLPDYIALKDGKLFGIELKKARFARLSDDQARTLGEMQQHGAVAGVCCSAQSVANMLSGVIPNTFVETPYGHIPVWQ
jgi:hypothetical protein